MSEQTDEGLGQIGEEAIPTVNPPQGTPAIGLDITGEEPDAIAGTVLRTYRHGFQPIVACEHQPDTEVTSILRQLEVTFASSQEDSTDAVLAKTAREQGHSGVIVHRNLGERIDFGSSQSALLDEAERYSIDAVTEAESRDEPYLVAGIPAYNESVAIGSTVIATTTLVDEVVVVDDGSEDETAEIAEEAGARVIGHDENRGYGAALKSIFREAERSDADHLVVLDGDGQHDSGDLEVMIQRLRDSDADMVIGSRFAPGSESELPMYRRFGIKVVNLLTNLSLGVVRRRSRVGDTQSGFRAYNRDAIESLAADETIGDGMGASTDILHHAHANDFEIEEVGITVEYDVENANHHQPVAHGLLLVNNLLRTIETERPVTVLGIPGFLSAFVGLGFGYWTFSNYLHSGVFSLGLALTATFFILLGVFAAFTAIILHALNTRRVHGP